MDTTLRRLAILLSTVLLAQTAAANPPLQTWHPWQLDSVLVAWALTQARTQTQTQVPEFESVERGQHLAPERAIDTPDATYRRTGQRTAFETAVHQEKLTHPCVAHLRDAVRVVELAAWRKPEHPGVEAFEARLLKTLPTQPARGGLQLAFAEIERYCQEAKK